MKFYDALTDFIFTEQKPEKADAIFVPGGLYGEIAQHAAELYQQGFASLIVPSGKYSIVEGKFTKVQSPEKYKGRYFETESDFLTAGNSSRAAYDDRQFLFREGIRIAQIVNAKMILFENVPNIQNKRIAKDSKELVIDYLKKELEEAGYGNFKEFVLDASKYGVPQKRKRFFILASKDSQIDVSQTPVETTSDKEVTVKDAFIDIPEVIANTWTENPNYLKEESEYTRLMKNTLFGKELQKKRNYLIIFQ